MHRGPVCRSWAVRVFVTPRDQRPVADITALLRAASGTRLRRLVDELADDERSGVRDALAAALARERARRRESSRVKRLYDLERRLRSDGWQVVAGVDEVGRGALAGPLSAGACVLPESPRLLGLNDSKLLSPGRREELAEQIKEVAVCWAVAHVPASEVDSLGMTAALRRVVGRALAGLELEPDHVVVDGLPLGVHTMETAVVGGDGRVASVAAASILAKVTRDAYMRSADDSHPDYGFAVHKGYGTPDHLAAIDRVGLCPEHRRSFMPCKGTDRLF